MFNNNDKYVHRFVSLISRGGTDRTTEVVVGKPAGGQGSTAVGAALV
jgi:hypothetical protein